MKLSIFRHICDQTYHFTLFYYFLLTFSSCFNLGSLYVYRNISIFPGCPICCHIIFIIFFYGCLYFCGVDC